MDSSLKGLFGSGPEADEKVAKSRDFVKRVSEGKPGEGYSTDEAVGQLNQLLKHANSDQVERATKAAISDLPEGQKEEFGQFVNQLKARKSGGRAATTAGSNTFSVDDISKMFGQAGGPAGSVDDLFGSLGNMFGGGTTTSTGRTGSSGGGIIAMIMKLLGGLFGGSKNQTANTAVAGGGADLGSLLGSNAGKMIMGGLAAYLTKEMVDGKN